MKDRQTKEKFIEMRSSGMSFDRIANELRLSKQTLINWSRELRHELANHKAIALEALSEKFLLQQHHRLSLFGEQLERVREELSKRELASIPTEKLFELLLKLTSVCRDEQAPLVFSAEEALCDSVLTQDRTWLSY